MTILAHPQTPEFDQYWQPSLESASLHPEFIEVEVWRSESQGSLHSTWRWLHATSHQQHFNRPGPSRSLPILSQIGPLECVEKSNSQRSAGFSSEFQNSIVERLFAKEHPHQKGIRGGVTSAGLPAIQISPFEGQILELLLRSIHARRGVEIGVLGGYSASWIARALGPTGELWALDRDPKCLKLAKTHLSQASELPTIHWIEGKASESLSKLSHLDLLDFVFIDADKASTPDYLRWAIPRLRVGGLVIIDNAYAWGAMMYLSAPQKPTPPPKGRFDHWSLKDYEALSETWGILASSSALHSVVLPTGEGLAVGLKIH